MSGKSVHHGRNIKRIREILGVKQEALALELGEDWSQRKISLLEGKEQLDAMLLAQIANALRVPVDAIENFNEEAAINIVSSTLHDNAGSINNHCTLTFNPLEKWLEALEENKKLYQEKIELYERMLKDKMEIIERLEKL